MSFCRKYLITGLCLAVLVVAAGGCSGPQGNAEDGKRWYMMHNCFACHGTNGNDGKAPDISGIDMSYFHFLSTVRNANSPIMPKFPEEKISKQDVADIYAWLKTK